MAALLVGLSIVAAPATAVAGTDDAHLPIVGRLYLNAGAEVRTGPILDWRDDTETDDTKTAVVAGPRLRFGLHHILTERLSMNAEGAVGAMYFGSHPVAIDGQGEEGLALDWSVTILGRYMPIGVLSGWTVAGGVHYRNLHLDDGRLLQFGVEGRVGYTVWTDDERFFIVELGLHAPLIEGMTLSQTLFTPDQQTEVPDQWYYPSASIGIQWAF